MFNCKITEYPDGTAQVRVYNPAVITGARPENSGNKSSDSSDSSESLEKSLSRTRNALHDYARCADWTWFVTLTFAPEKVDRTNFKECMAKARNWLQNVRKRFAPDIKYLVVPELHADGVSWHIHALLADIEFSDTFFKKSGRKSNGMDIYNLSKWHFGFSTATKVRDIASVKKYILKYITKQSIILSAGQHRYYVSNNLPKPKVSKFYGGTDELPERVHQELDRLGGEQSWNTFSSEYVNITYIDIVR